MNRRSVAIIVVVVLAAAYWVLIARNTRRFLFLSDSALPPAPGNWKQLGPYRDVTVWRLDE